MNRRTHVRQSYAIGTKRSAVVQVLAEGKTQAEVARAMGIAEQTVNNWVSAARRNPAVFGVELPGAVAAVTNITNVTPEAVRAWSEHELPPDAVGLAPMRNAVLGALHALSVIYPDEAKVYDRVATVVRGLGLPRTP
jgi:transposase-like protein